MVTRLPEVRVSPNGVARYQEPYSGSVAFPVKVAPDNTILPPLTVENKIPVPGDPEVFVVIVTTTPEDVAETKLGARRDALIAAAMFVAVMLSVAPRVKSVPAMNVTVGPPKGAGEASIVKVSPTCGVRQVIVP
jgi:hypothetical protein